MQQFIGWAASAVLVATIGWQVAKQWREDSSKGVSVWLFLGQITANALFLVYAAMTGDRVFMVANGLLLMTSLVGLGIKYRHARQNRNDAPDHAAMPSHRRPAQVSG